MATNPSGKRADGTHWQSDKMECVRGHDLRPVIDGEPNPNVRRHVVTGTRQCAECSRMRARLTVRLQTATRWWDDHQAVCEVCRGGNYCAHGRQLRSVVHLRISDMLDAGFDSPRLVHQ